MPPCLTGGPAMRGLLSWLLVPGELPVLQGYTASPCTPFLSLTPYLAPRAAPCCGPPPGNSSYLYMDLNIGINTPQLCTCNYVINFPLNKITSHSATYPPFSIFIAYLNEDAQPCPPLPVNTCVSTTAVVPSRKNASAVPCLAVPVHIRPTTVQRRRPTTRVEDLLL